MNQKRPSFLWEAPCPSTQFWQTPWLELTAGAARICYQYETKNGAFKWDALKFLGLRGFQFTQSLGCDAEQIKAYDKLAEMSDSDWIRTLQEKARAVERKLRQARHFRIYFDDIGCYDIAAEEWQYLPDIDPPPAGSLLRNRPSPP